MRKRKVERKVEGELSVDKSGDDSIRFRMWIGLKARIEAHMATKITTDRRSVWEPLRKDERGVRGIVAGSIIRRLAGRALALQYGDKLLAATSPWQFALHTRAGTDALARTVKWLTERDPQKTVVSLDGLGAFDHVHRAAFLRKLHAKELFEKPRGQRCHKGGF